MHLACESAVCCIYALAGGGRVGRRAPDAPPLPPPLVQHIPPIHDGDTPKVGPPILFPFIYSPSALSAKLVPPMVCHCALHLITLAMRGLVGFWSVAAMQQTIRPCNACAHSVYNCTDEAAAACLISGALLRHTRKQHSQLAPNEDNAWMSGWKPLRLPA